MRWEGSPVGGGHGSASAGGLWRVMHRLVCAALRSTYLFRGGWEALHLRAGVISAPPCQAPFLVAWGTSRRASGPTRATAC
eukprot:945216-Pyramimonas_sp.AAC.1